MYWYIVTIQYILYKDKEDDLKIQHLMDKISKQQEMIDDLTVQLTTSDKGMSLYGI